MVCSRICSVSGFQSSSKEWVDVDQLSNQLLILLMNAGMVEWSRKDALYRTKYLLRNQRHDLNPIKENEPYSFNREMTAPNISCILTTQMRLREAGGSQ